MLLLTKNLRLRKPNKKLLEKFIGPFTIVEIIGKQAYKLDLPMSLEIHPTFHVSLLEPYYEKGRESVDAAEPILVESAGGEELDSITVEPRKGVV